MEERTRCIVLLPKEADDVRQLDAELNSHGWTCTTREDAFDAMGELCLCHRSEASRAAWGLEPREVIAMLIPTDHPDAGDIAAALQAYFPDVRIWSYADGTLDLVHEGAIDQSMKDNPVVEPQVGHRMPTELKLTDAAPLPDPPGQADFDDEPDDEHTPACAEVTEEELAMLLAFEPPVGEAEG